MSGTKFDYEAAARALCTRVADNPGLTYADLIGLAQVYATLALVDTQRSTVIENVEVHVPRIPPPPPETSP